MRRFISRWKGRYNYLLCPVTPSSSWLKRYSLKDPINPASEPGDVVTYAEETAGERERATKKTESAMLFMASGKLRWWRRSAVTN
jgi:hypothetical protein